VHGSAPDITGQDLANPTAIALSLAMLLTWLGDRHGRREYIEAAKTLEAAIDDQLADEKGRTKDLGGPLGTTAFGTELVARLAG
jgi:3-isopropylmalate dehydrogenase